MALPAGTLLDGQYCIERVLGRPGGFGITYLALEEPIRRRVAVKEFFPRDLVGRYDGLTVQPHSSSDGEIFDLGIEQFLREAQTLARITHENVVRVLRFFEANGTAYIVMEFYEGQTLSAYIEQRGGRLPVAEALELVAAALAGLEASHAQGILHRDIKPENTYLRADLRPLLLDFGNAKQLSNDGRSMMAAAFTPPYAPLEQYTQGGHQGPWTDVYACAVMLYRAISGALPPEAPDRANGEPLVPLSKLVPGVPQPVETAVLGGLAMDRNQRPQTASAFRASLQALLAGAKGGPLPESPKPRMNASANAAVNAPDATMKKRAGIALIAAAVVTLLFVSQSVFAPANDPEPADTTSRTITPVPVVIQPAPHIEPPPRPAPRVPPNVQPPAPHVQPPAEVSAKILTPPDTTTAELAPETVLFVRRALVSMPVLERDAKYADAVHLVDEALATLRSLSAPQQRSAQAVGFVAQLDERRAAMLRHCTDDPKRVGTCPR